MAVFRSLSNVEITKCTWKDRAEKNANAWPEVRARPSCIQLLRSHLARRRICVHNVQTEKAAHCCQQKHHRNYTSLWLTSRQVATLRLLDLCHSIGLRPSFLALRASTRPAVSISTCCLDLGLRPQFSMFRASTRSRLFSSIMDAPLCVAALMMRHHSDDVCLYDVTPNRCEQLCCGLRGVAAKF